MSRLLSDLGRASGSCYTAAFTAGTERSSAQGALSERGTVRAARVAGGVNVAREPCGRRPIARREEAGGPPAG